MIQYSVCDLALLNNSVYNLQTRLFEGYNSYIRPVKEQKTITYVKADLSLMQVISMNDAEESLTISGFLNFAWTDEMMVWNPAQEGNLTMIPVPVDQLWTPDIFLYSAADQGSWNQWDTSYVLVNLNYNGSCYVTPPALITTYCQLNIENFPFDEKICKMKYGSWMYTTDFLRLTSGSEVLLNQYTPNSAWSLDDTSQVVDDQAFDDSGGLYSILTVTLHFRRRTLFFSFNFILPSIVITVCSIFGFMLPPDSGEKIGLQITNLLGVVFFLQYVSTIVPPSSMGVAKISLYFFSTSVLCMLSLIGNVIVLDLHGRDIRIETDMPEWLDKLVCVYLAKILGMKRRVSDNKVDIEKSKSSINIQSLVETIKNPKQLEQSDSDLGRRVINIETILSKIWQEMSDRAIDEEKELKWKFAAIVMDRFFLYLSIIYFLVTFIPIVLTIKNLYRAT